MNLGLDGKVAMVAGASRGLGYAVAEALAREGARVSIASRDEQAINAAAARIGGDVLAVPVEVRSADAIRRWAAETEKRFGGVDLLFTNSGGPPAGAALSFDDAAWQDAAELLLFSTLRMVESGGRYSDRKVTYFRVFDPAAMAQRSVEVKRYTDLDPFMNLVLQSGHVESDGKVVVTRPRVVRAPSTATRAAADRSQHQDDAHIVVHGETGATANPKTADVAAASETH